MFDYEPVWTPVDKPSSSAPTATVAPWTHGWKAAMFDFDGTLSAIRYDWTEVMADYCVQQLNQWSADDSSHRQWAEHMVHTTGGVPTLQQMQLLVNRISETAPVAEDSANRSVGTAQQHKDDYLVQMRQRFLPRHQQLQQLRSAETDARSRRSTVVGDASLWQVAGAETILKDLSRQGVLLVLASGTDYLEVRNELELLNLKSYFPDDQIFCPHKYPGPFSKQDAIDWIFEQTGATAGQWLGFGDGAEETRLVHAAGGVAIGLATPTSDQIRGMDPWKEKVLTASGAAALMSDFRCTSAVLQWLSQTQLGRSLQ